jgi:hypothetical protein
VHAKATDQAELRAADPTRGEDAAAELAIELATFRRFLAGARLEGFDIETAPKRFHA